MAWELLKKNHRGLFNPNYKIWKWTREVVGKYIKKPQQGFSKRYREYHNDSKNLKLIINEKSGKRNRHLEFLPRNLEKRSCLGEYFIERIESKRKREGKSKKMRKWSCQTISGTLKQEEKVEKNQKSSSNFEGLKEFLSKRHEDWMENRRKELELLENEFNMQHKHMQRHQDMMIKMMEAK